MGVKIFSVAKRKGGVGASSVTVMLATTLAKYRNKKVLIIDTDDQATIADLSLIDEGQGISPLVQVMQMNPARVHLFLQSRKNDYDIIFIDLPRMSNLDSDDKLVMLMYLCDGLLIPILPSKLAVLSTVKFVGIAKDVVKHRLDYGNETILHGFLSLANNRTDTEDAKDFFIEEGLSMFDARIPNLKIFANVSVSESIIDTRDGRKRFESFFNEFIEKYNIK